VPQQFHFFAGLVAALFPSAFCFSALATETTTSMDGPVWAVTSATASPASNEPEPGTRYGLFDLLDRRSTYGTDWFPEPLVADEADVDNEVTFRYSHFEHTGEQFDAASAEFEHAFGLLTLELAGGYQSDRTATFDPTTGLTDRQTQAGFTNIELGARFPFFEYVSPDEKFDDTFVFGLEVSPPTLSPVSQDTEIVPKVFNLLRLGDHFSLQTGLGLSTLVGPVAHGLQTVEYDAVFGYELTHDVLPIPGIAATVPIFEVDGEWSVNQDVVGQNTLFGTAGFRLNLKPVSFIPAQPKLGFGYTFPIDAGARASTSWGIVTSIIFEY
jgi:hypothetical protein